MKFYKERELRDKTQYTKVTADFILDLYSKSKKMAPLDKQLLLVELKELSQHLNEYILKPSAPRKS